ncbi:MAG: MFS transporter [Planctomycetaceae bacterium]
MAFQPPDTTPPTTATRIRHFVVFVSMLMAVLLYLDRFCISFAANYIRDDLGLTQANLGLMMSAFFLSYALAQVPSGWLSDFYGARIMLTVYILTWSLFTFLTGAVFGLAMLLLMRVACGLGQAGAYPTSASVISKWVPFSGRGTASSIVALGGRFGGAVAPLLTAYLIVLLVPIDPSGTGERFSNDDILWGGKSLCGHLVPAETTGVDRPTAPNPATGRVWQLVRPGLSVPLADRTIAIAREYQQRQKQPTRSPAAEPGTVMTDEHRQALVIALNKLIDSGDLFEAQAFSRLKKLPREAITLLNQHQRDDGLPEPQRRRFHRLLLESTFAGDLKGLYVRGWRPVMYIYGAAGLLVALLYWMIVRNRPEEHPRANAAEHARIAAGRPPNAPSPHGKPDEMGTIVAALIRSRSMWCDCLMQTGGNIGWLFLVSFLAIYLMEVHEVPILQRGLLVSAPMFVGMIGMLIGGRFTDALVPRIGLKWGRRLPLVATKLSAAAAYGCCLWFSTLPPDSPLNSPVAFTVLFCVVAFSTDFGNPAGWAFKQDVGGRYVGSVLGWGNMWGNLGATISPLIYAAVLGDSPEISDWNTLFIICMIAFVFSGTMALGIDATQPIAPPDEQHESGQPEDTPGGFLLDPVDEDQQRPSR